MKNADQRQRGMAIRAARASVTFIALGLTAAGAYAKQITLPPDNPMATLKPGPGVETVKDSCSICHSTDYIVRQPGSNAGQWESEVTKMIKTYGAPISEEEAKTIVNYLAAEYGLAPATLKTPAKKER